MARFRNAYSTSIDDVPPGGVGEFNPAAVRGLIDAGHLVPADGDGAETPSKRPIDAGERAQFDRYARETADELARREARITELEVELAQVKLDLEAATAPKKPKA